MNFINDIVTYDDVYRFNLNSLKLAPAFTENLPSPAYWTVDRESDAYLLSLGGYRRQMYKSLNEDQCFEYFRFYWNNAYIECKLWCVHHAVNAITWRQDWILIPYALTDKKMEIMNFLKQALSVYQSQEHLHNIKIKFVPLFVEVKFDF